MANDSQLPSDSALASASGSVQYRRVVIELEIHGTSEQANSVRDAVGLAADDDWLGGIVTPIVFSEEIKAVNWQVRGERWMPDAPNAALCDSRNKP